MSDEARPVRDLLMVLSATGDRQPGERFVLDRDPLRLGRGTANDVLLSSDCIARRHTHLERHGDTWWVVDGGSTNGTLVNGVMIPHRQALRSGDRITIGNVILAYLHGDDVETLYQDEVTRLSYFDPLTGVGNQHLLREAVEREIGLARQHRHDLCVALFDIDRFKRINDEHGHLVGDLVLRALARLLQAHLADAGILARHTGDSFALLMPETTLEEAAALCDDTRAMVARHPFDLQGEIVSLTVSAGLGELAPADDSSASLLARAEANVHAAKAAGRNCLRR